MARNELHIREVPNGLVVAGAKCDETVVTRASGFVASEAAGEWGMGRYTGARPGPTHDEIAQLAYYFYQSRGRQGGHDTEDWLRAEQQLVHHYALLPTPAHVTNEILVVSFKRKSRYDD